MKMRKWLGLLSTVVLAWPFSHLWHVEESGTGTLRK